MGQTIYNVPRRITRHAEAKKLHDTIVPIRNHVPEHRPLGARRDHDKYRVQMRDDGAVEFVLYRTPVITYLPDDTIEIRNGGYASPSTHEFFSWVLGMEANGFMGKTKLGLGGDVYMLGHDEVLPLVRDEQGKLVFGRKQEQIGYRMNRKAANKVRARYKEFAEYLAGFASLRTEEVENRRPYIRVPVNELAQTLGVTPAHRQNNGVQTYGLAIKFDRLTEPYARGWARDDVKVKRPLQTMQFLSLIASDQPEEDKHMNFYKAALALVVGDRAAFVTVEGDGQIGATKMSGEYALRSPKALVEYYDTALMMAHAEEVLELTKLEQGKLPNRKYVGWVLNQPEGK